MRKSAGRKTGNERNVGNIRIRNGKPTNSALNFDHTETWETVLRTLLINELPSNIDSILINAKPKYIEDARDIILGFGSRDAIIGKISAWLESQAFVAFHGSRLNPEEIQAVRLQGLRPLVAEGRAMRLTRIFSSHPRWPAVEPLLPDVLRRYGQGNAAGHREGQVHLTISAEALTRSFNHYLVEGSEFDKHVGYHLFGADGCQMLRSHGKPIMFEVHIPAELAFAACNPYGTSGIDPPSPIHPMLALWGYRMAYPGYKSENYLIDAGIVFRHTVPPDWIKETIHLNDADLLRFYRP